MPLDDNRAVARLWGALDRHDEREDCEASLVTFLQQAWPHLGEAGEFVDNWHHEVIAAQLEALAAGRLRNLIINQPPRTTKSLMCSVAFPAWVWCQPKKKWGPLMGPHVRFLCVSYGATLAEEMAVKMRRLVTGEWYQRHWGKQIELREDQAARANFANMKGGERLSSSIEGGILGRGGDCVAGDAIIHTLSGRKRIDDLDLFSSPEYVLSYDFGMEAPAYRRVVAFSERGSRPVWRIHTRQGNVVEATGEHPVFTRRGWVQAMALNPGDVLLRSVRRSGATADGRGREGSEEQEARVLLRPRLRDHLAQQFAGLQAARLQGMRRAGSIEGGVGVSLLRRGVPESDVSAKGGRSADYRTSLLRGLRRRLQASLDKCAQPVLLNGMQKCWTFVSHAWGAQSGLPTWPGSPLWVAAGVVRGQTGGMGSGWSGLRQLREHGQGRGPSYRPGPAEPRTDQPRLSLPQLSHDIAWRRAFEAEEDIVCVVERVREEKLVYDIQVEGSKCFFANGILVHNCQIIDDPHHIKGAESDLQRRETLEGMRALVTRVTDPRIAARVLVMQRLHEDDATNYALQHWEDARHLMLPMRFDPRRADPDDARAYDPMSGEPTDAREGELLWPEVWTEKAVQAEENELQAYGTAGQLQQTPIPRGGGIIKRKWWRLWPDDYPEAATLDPIFHCGVCQWHSVLSGDYRDEIECPSCGSTAGRHVPFPPFSYRILSVDTAYGEKQENSWSAATCWGIWHDKEEAPRAMLMDAWRGRPRLRGIPDSTNPSERKGLVERVYDMATRRQVDTVLIERKTRGTDLYNELERLMGEWPFQLAYFEPVGSKEIRLEACVSLFSNDRVWAPDKGWAETVISEVASQPKAQFNDLADTVAAALAWMRGRGLLSLGDEHRLETRRALIFRGRADRSSIREAYEGS